ncbi:uncharacterized protein YwqG-like [Paramacrobiotus metropolitanus]|uniref:uncharacterized protein YwqG-like n=1 Tax=Paramacrobiotus metropolitanus TaxID=2943436 RepID=UPI0024464835|nr:uncharacterized protein YwqG-like [Paramacrobiotus metropolitanus]
MDSRALPVIPPELAPFAEKIRATLKDAVNIKLHPAKNLQPWQSKVGGTPYLPKSAEYPRSSAGSALLLLAQINFAETPRLSGYPDKGILQFFIDPTDDMMGLNLNSNASTTEQDLFRVQYFPDVTEDASQLQTELPFRIEGENIVDVASGKESQMYWPLERNVELAMEFQPFQQYMTPNDYRREEIFGGETYDTRPEAYEAFDEHLRSNGHQIGGYPVFTQEDPRTGSSDLRGYELLFQLDSDGTNGIMWGDMGVGNFFIRPEDLEKRDFSKVAYNWDCC